MVTFQPKKQWKIIGKKGGVPWNRGSKRKRASRFASAKAVATSAVKTA